MNFRVLWLVLVGVFAYLLFYELNEEYKINYELAARYRLAKQEDSVLIYSNTNKIKQTIKH